MRRRALRWALLTVGIPALVWALDAVGERLERSREPSLVTKALREPKRRRTGRPIQGSTS